MKSFHNNETQDRGHGFICTKGGTNHEEYVFLISSLSVYTCMVIYLHILSVCVNACVYIKCKCTRVDSCMLGDIREPATYMYRDTNVCVYMYQYLNICTTGTMHGEIVMNVNNMI